MVLVRSADGAKHPAVVLSLIGSTIRVAMKDREDVEEYHLVNETWVSTQCEPVTFEFPLGIFEAIGIMPPGSRVFVRQ